MVIYRYLICGIAFCFVCTGICSAEPNSTMRYLMNEKASMLDIGAIQLEAYLNNNMISASDPYVKATVIYNFESNNITIQVDSEDIDTFRIEAAAKSWCEAILCEIRTTLGVDCSSLESFFSGGNSIIYQFFIHNGYQAQSQPTNLASELDKTVILHVGAYWRDSEGPDYLKPIYCKVPLFGAEIMWSD